MSTHGSVVFYLSVAFGSGLALLGIIGGHLHYFGGLGSYYLVADIGSPHVSNGLFDANAFFVVCSRHSAGFLLGLSPCGVDTYVALCSSLCHNPQWGGGFLIFCSHRGSDFGFRILGG